VQPAGDDGLRNKTAGGRRHFLKCEIELVQGLPVRLPGLLARDVYGFNRCFDLEPANHRLTIGAGQLPFAVSDEFVAPERNILFAGWHKYAVDGPRAGSCMTEGNQCSQAERFRIVFHQAAGKIRKVECFVAQGIGRVQPVMGVECIEGFEQGGAALLQNGPLRNLKWYARIPDLGLGSNQALGECCR